MTFGSKARWLVLVGALVAFAPALAGCPKKKDDSSSDSKSSDGKKKKSGDDDNSDSADFSRGDVLKHVPKSCKMARAYIDWTGLLADPALKVHAEKIDDKFAQALKGDSGKKAEDALKILKKAKIDPGKDIHELAICANDDKQDMVVVIGGDFAGKDVLGALQKIAESQDETLKKKDGDGFSYVQGKDKAVIAQLTPNVFAVTDKGNVDSLADLVKANDQSDKFDAGKGRVIVVKGSSKKDGVDEASLELTNKGDEQELTVSATLSGKAKKSLGSDPDQAKQAIKQGIKEVAKMVDSSPAADLADDLRDAKVKVDGDTVTVTMKIPNKDLAKSLQKLIDMQESDLEQLANK